MPETVEQDAVLGADIMTQSAFTTPEIVKQSALNQPLTSEDVPPPFWSVLSAETLQAYTWLPPWQPQGSSYVVPTLQVMGSPSKDFVFGSDQSETLQSFAEGDLILALGGDDFLLAGDGDDALLGGEGNDVLSGEAGNDLLEGENGNDWLNGGAGIDTLTGGAGQDVFAFILEPSLGPDTVTDFTIGEDLLLVGGLLQTQPVAGSDPFTAYIQLTQLAQGTLVTVQQTDGLGQTYQTDIAVLANISVTDLSASSFALA